VQKLNAMFVTAANDPELTERFDKLGVERATGTPDDFKRALESDNARLGPLIKELMATAK
jgi:tripartite-type tricarboxylate transporter receptor subunit TctC